MATPSIAENLRHLEMHITDYMHEHAVGTGDILYVQPKGFRFPYKATKETLDENMKYLEMLLEEFLHDHETVTGVGSGGELMGDGGFESSFGFGPNGNEVPGNADTAGLTYPYFNWSDGSQDGNLLKVGQIVQQEDANTEAIISNINPQAGTYHLRLQSLAAGFFDDLYFGSEVLPQAVGESDGSFGFPISPGQEWTFSFDFMAPNIPTDTTVLLFPKYYDSSAGVTEREGPFSGIVLQTGPTASYTNLSYTATTPDTITFADAPDYMFLRMRVQNASASPNKIADIDNVSMFITEDPSVLYTNQVGFRFPHPWKEEWAIKENVKHLEDQLSRWLHRHVEGT